MTTIDDYPGIRQYLDNTDDYENSVAETNLNGERLLIVTQVSDSDGGQVVFRWDGEDWLPIDSDNFVEISGAERAATLAARSSCSKSSDADHEAVHTLSLSLVNDFSSATGPDGGNLACVWAVRHIVRRALNRWITRTDGTSVFDTELQRCYGATWQEADVPAGGIIISPTVTLNNGNRNIGHVGLLGPGGVGLQRLVYSNSSARKRWEQNHTLESWIARYRTQKGLKVRFYPLPLVE